MRIDKAKIAIIVDRSPGQIAFFQNLVNILISRYEVEIYYMPQFSKFPYQFYDRMSSIFSNGFFDILRCETNSIISSHIKILYQQTIIIFTLIYIFVLSLILAFRFDIIISHDVYCAGVFSPLFCRIFGKRSIIIIVGDFLEERRYLGKNHVGLIKLKLLHLLEHISINFSDIINSPDPVITKYLQSRQAKAILLENKFRLINYDIFKRDNCIRDSYRKQFGIPIGCIALLFVGWLTEWDGADRALAIYKKLLENKKDIYLIFIGSGHLDSYIKDTISNEGLKNVRLTGYVPHMEVHNYMMMGDIALLPLREPQCGIGAIPLELMSLEIPLIVNDVGAFRELISNGYGGFIVTGDIIQESAKKASLMIENPCLLNKMGQSARKIIEQDFSQEIASKKVFSLIETCLNNNRHRKS